MVEAAEFIPAGLDLHRVHPEGEPLIRIRHHRTGHIQAVVTLFPQFFFAGLLKPRDEPVRVRPYLVADLLGGGAARQLRHGDIGTVVTVVVGVVSEGHHPHDGPQHRNIRHGGSRRGGHVWHRDEQCQGRRGPGRPAVRMPLRFRLLQSGAGCKHPARIVLRQGEGLAFGPFSQHFVKSIHCRTSFLVISRPAADAAAPDPGTGGS